MGVKSVCSSMRWLSTCTTHLVSVASTYKYTDSQSGSESIQIIKAVPSCTPNYLLMTFLSHSKTHYLFSFSNKFTKATTGKVNY